ncbi:hypothetical protein IQ230_23980 [Gloeocapsopsis crepidinum LEGE 06123]|uniref:Uncharacterized protein n=1 Tax=Gloeocapsopsis crepidinum LEGE 06123 TaxID=588587 RepID=A0ABR9V0K1_9CHRO|nr:hypothetical protein [Gloeocapsopsis crepidinum]MBE9193345.1 hypothetical protein [Gloeocapsopsis crepidinum LEGE 06123]
MSEVSILPPLETTKKQPHASRTAEVFHVLDEAQAQGITTYDALIDFVRQKTGTGCSRKLISKWKKERAASVTSETNAQNLPVKVAAITQDNEVQSEIQQPESLDTASQRWQQNSFRKCIRRLQPIQLRKLLVPVAAMSIGITLLVQVKPTLGDRVTTNTQATTPVPAPSNTNLPRTLKFSLSVSSPTDLKVNKGDKVEAGQVIAERVEERDRLQAELDSLNLQYQQASSRVIPKPTSHAPVSVIKQLPPISYAKEEAAIRAAESNLRQAERAFSLQQQSMRSSPIAESNAVERALVEVENKQRIVDNQKRKLDAVGALKDLPAVLEHEQEVLKAKEAELKQAVADQEQAQAKLEAASRNQVEKLQQLGAAVEKARSDLQVAIAKLQTKKDTRAHQEYEASIIAARRVEERNALQDSYSRNLLAAEQQERDRQFQLAQIKAKIDNVNTQLTNLSVVTSPYDGTVKVIKFRKQSNNDLLVELTLSVDGATAATTSSSGAIPATTATNREQRTTNGGN